MMTEADWELARRERAWPSTTEDSRQEVSVNCCKRIRASRVHVTPDNRDPNLSPCNRAKLFFCMMSLMTSLPPIAFLSPAALGSSAALSSRSSRRAATRRRRPPPQGI